MAPIVFKMTIYDISHESMSKQNPPSPVHLPTIPSASHVQPKGHLSHPIGQSYIAVFQNLLEAPTLSSRGSSMVSQWKRLQHNHLASRVQHRGLQSQHIGWSLQLCHFRTRGRFGSKIQWGAEKFHTRKSLI